MLAVWFIGFSVGAVILAVIWDRWRLRRLARSRPAWTRQEFRNSLIAAGVDDDIESFLWDEFQPYYAGGLTLQPDDRWQSTLHVDPLDLIDIADRLWKQRGWGDPDYDKYPALDADTTLLGFAQWLQLHKYSHSSPPKKTP